MATFLYAKKEKACWLSTGRPSATAVSAKNVHGPVVQRALRRLLALDAVVRFLCVHLMAGDVHEPQVTCMSEIKEVFHQPDELC